MKKENIFLWRRRKRRKIFGERGYLTSGGEGKGGKYLERAKIIFLEEKKKENIFWREKNNFFGGKIKRRRKEKEEIYI